MIEDVASERRREGAFVAQRAGIRARLVHLGMGTNLAERWLGAWEASSNMEAERLSFDFWDRGGRWAAAAWVAGQVPPTIERS
jgi:hypothetical protein